MNADERAELAEAIAERVIAKVREPLLQLPEEFGEVAALYPGYLSRMTILGGTTSPVVQTRITPQGGFVFELMDCTGRPLIAPLHFSP